MSLINFTDDILCGFCIGSEKRASDDKDYYLCISKDFKIVVIIDISPNKPYSNPYKQSIESDKFSEYQINGLSLKEIVTKQFEKFSEMI